VPRPNGLDGPLTASERRRNEPFIGPLRPTGEGPRVTFRAIRAILLPAT